MTKLEETKPTKVKMEIETKIVPSKGDWDWSWIDENKHLTGGVEQSITIRCGDHEVTETRRVG